MWFGPVFTFELITTARRGRYYAARVAYGLMLLFTFWTEYHYMLQRQQFISIKKMGAFAESAFIAFAWGQGLMLLALIPAMVAGVVADEHQRKTLHYLLASQLTSSEIVLGKLGARLIHAGVLVLIGLPVVCLIGMYGGLDPWKVLYIYAGTFSIALFLAGMSMLVSVVARRPRDAILMAYGLEAAWLFLLPVFAHLAPFFSWPIAVWLVPITYVGMATHPTVAWGHLRNYAEWGVRFAGRPPSTQWLTSMAAEIHQAFLWMTGLQAVLGCLFLILAVTLLRPLRGGTRGRRRRGWLARRREREAVARPGCGDDPMIWKERYAGRGGGLAWLTSLPVVLVLGTLLGCYLFDAAWPAFGELIFAREDDKARFALNAELRLAGALLFSLWLVAVSSSAAVGVTSEREEDTWTSLTATLLTGPEIVRAKMFGAAWGARRMGVALLVVWGVGLLSGAVHPLGLLAALAGLGIYTWFATALGLWMSLKARNSTRAMIGTILLMVALNVGYLFLLTPLFKKAPPVLTLAGITPFVEWVALFSYRDVHALWSGQAFTQVYELRHGPQTLAMVVASFALYALGALGLTRAAVAAFDTAVGRPRRGAKGDAGKGGASVRLGHQPGELPAAVGAAPSRWSTVPAAPDRINRPRLISGGC